MNCGLRLRWVGPAAQGTRGRRRQYSAAQLGDQEEQVFINDIVEVAKHPPELPHRRPRLAQVLSMWEDAFTGVFRFQARWLVRREDLPSSALSTLCAARQTFTADSPEDIAMVADSHRQKGDTKDEDREVFLTTEVEDLDLRTVSKPMELLQSDGITDVKRSGDGSAKGLRLTHSYDLSTGEFAPLLDTHDVLTRATCRRLGETMQRKPEAETGESHVDTLTSSSGWQKRKTSSAGTTVSVAKSSKRSKMCPQEAEVESSDGSGGDVSHIVGTKELASSVGCTNTPEGNSPQPRDLAHRHKPKVWPASPWSDVKLEGALHSSMGPTSSRKTQDACPSRPTRLAMPFAFMKENQPEVGTCKTRGDGNLPIAADLTTRPAARTRMASGSLTRNSWGRSRRPSISGKRKLSGGSSGGRATTTKVSTTAGQSSSCLSQCSTPVGKAHQVDIPALLSADERKHPPTRTGARMVWRSIREWDSHSIELLNEYLHAAREAVREKQSRLGVPVHVRLGGGEGTGDADQQRDSAGSYAVWAVTHCRDHRGVARVACSEMAQTEVPRSAIQRVQCEEDALTALVKTKCVLDDFEPALDMLANNQASLQSVQPWTLTQVRTLEKALEKEFDPDRHAEGWTNLDLIEDREDFIDLAKVIKQVPGKSPTQVLSLYYKYFASAQPLTDVVYGPEAAKARRKEAIIPPPGEVTMRAVEPSTQDSIIRPRLHTGHSASQAKISNNSSVGSGGGSISSGAGESKSARRIIRLSSPKPVDEVSDVDKNLHIVSSNVNSGGGQDDASGSTSAVSSAVEGNRVEQGDSSTFARDGCHPSVRGSSNGNPTRDECGQGKGVVKHTAPSVSTCAWKAVTCAVSASGEDNGEGGKHRRWRVPREGRPPKAMPPQVEVLEVEDDSGDEKGNGHEAMQASAMQAARRPKIVPWSGVPYAVHHWKNGPGAQRKDEIAMMEEQHHHEQAPPDPARASGGGRMPTIPRESVSGREEQGPVRWEGSPLRREGSPLRRGTTQRGREAFESSRWTTDRAEFGGVGGKGPEETSTLDEFGSMAPCWRLLQRAQGYMVKDQLAYMKGLILAHVTQPMARDQVLERAHSCLQEQREIYAAFVKIFDRIEQPGGVPFYPDKRNASTAPELVPQGSKHPSTATCTQYIPHRSPASLALRVPEPPPYATMVADRAQRRPIATQAGGARGHVSSINAPVSRGSTVNLAYGSLAASLPSVGHYVSDGWGAMSSGSNSRVDGVGRIGGVPRRAMDPRIPRDHFSIGGQQTPSFPNAVVYPEARRG